MHRFARPQRTRTGNDVIPAPVALIVTATSMMSMLGASLNCSPAADLSTERSHQFTGDSATAQNIDDNTELQAALPARTTTSLDDPCHTHHPMYQHPLTAIHHAESERGIAPRFYSERVAAALVPSAKPENITHIDRVLLSERGHRVFAEKKGSMPGINDKIAFVDTDKAIHTTIAQSTAAMSTVSQQQHDRDSIKMPAQPPAVAGPTLSDTAR